MGQYSEANWYVDRVSALVKQYGAVPPPWVYAEDSHPFSIQWRMGDGETHVMVFGEWWEQQKLTEKERIEYFRKWPPPPRWTAWMAEVIWDLDPWKGEGEGEFDYSPYFKRLTDLGFEGVADYERDLDDEKWL